MRIFIIYFFADKVLSKYIRH